MGIKLADKFLFFDLSPAELESLRKKYIMKTIIENEAKRLNIAEITIYDGSGHIYLGSEREAEACLQHPEAPGFPLFPRLLHGDTRIRTGSRATPSGGRARNFIMLLFSSCSAGPGGFT